ncbi:related to 3-deoxy-D-manno-octulosonic-acid transferase [Desulfotalea psychrophila LSv54]|uniref:3-deoxy-D-manno-octulosonic acid transferase n=2 Tax=Desulfotalea psychrophila TaxID=84980 RepID=Q6AJD4_DESPS|nr:related to 3-deoxy-D-manno-octulosonic-acid transferase [Desulfotalea psychrophila LSv54]
MLESFNLELKGPMYLYKNLLLKIFLAFYSLLWRIALPVLRCFPRLSNGWQQRTLHEVHAGPFDLWLQAASGGESLLSLMVLRQLQRDMGPVRGCRILLSAGTSQGVGILLQGKKEIEAVSDIEVQVVYFPLDAPFIMRSALKIYRPKVIAIIETELWPGLLYCARQASVPVLIVNGRMSAGSYRSYRHLRPFFRDYGPKKIFAIAGDDQRRFADVFGIDRVQAMHNMKFDRLDTLLEPAAKKFAFLEKKKFVVLGSIRRQEEEEIVLALKRFLDERPDVVVGIFPKHIERVASLASLLRQNGIEFTQRSDLDVADLHPEVSVVLWDLFGELASAYAYAHVAFVGGSLAPLGGQNFLEPLAHGVRPIIGPHWQDFAWVGRGVIEHGLVREVADSSELVAVLCEELERECCRERFREQIEEFFADKKGGTGQVCAEIGRLIFS